MYVSAATSFQSLRILESLRLSNINGIPFDNIATTSKNLQFHAPLEFANVRVDSIKTDDFISSVNFNYWFNMSLSSVKDSAINSNWAIENLYLKSNLDGNGNLNGSPVIDVLDKIEKQSTSNKAELLGASNDYDTLCNEVKTLAEKTTEDINYFKFFESAFTLKQQKPIYSAFSFKSHECDQLLLNVGCESFIYKWDVSAKEFEKVNVIKTGYVKRAISVDIGPEESHIMILSDRLNHECQYKGLNVHRNQNGVFTSYRHADESLQIIDINANVKNSSRFYALSSDNKVRELDYHLTLIEEWQLPITTGAVVYRFLPDGITNGISLNEGRHIISLASIQRRTKRNLGDTTEASVDSEKMLELGISKLKQQTEWLEHLIKPKAEEVGGRNTFENNSSR